MYMYLQLLLIFWLNNLRFYFEQRLKKYTTHYNNDLDIKPA